ncbi:MAG TPA: sigma-70 family RNA polymerase sigma factor [Mycobacteriales bacterium]|nr:sigma-70 family RNA polymerase sigma factor [Mycobacteriales bacterium]
MTEPPARPGRPDGTPPGPITGEAGDRELVARLADRDGGALDVLYQRYGRPAYSLALRITSDSGFAEDVVQEVFLALWRDPSRYDAGRGGFASWLLSMTHHKAVDAVRREESLRRRRQAATDDTMAMMDETGPGPSVDEEVWTVLRGERVREALRELPGPQREALTLAYFGGFTQREVASLTDTPLGTVKTRMLAGMRKLRESLGGGLREGGAGL